MGMPTPILPPGSTIGVFGSGQLGRMLAQAALTMGYQIHVFSPEADSPAGQLCQREVVGAYTDDAAVGRFVAAVDLVTFEFENVPASVATVAARAGVPVRPAAAVLHTAQHRLREKRFLATAGLPVAPFREVESVQTLAHALTEIGCPALLKTATFGYDGKGQVPIDAPTQATAAWAALGSSSGILERFVPFRMELSVVAARGLDGSFTAYGAIENVHRNQILDSSVAPARVDSAIAAAAVDLARQVMERLQVVGVLCVEFFLTPDNRLLINELAPRPHNSGHLTLDAAVTSQFEQQLRAICGLPLGDSQLLRPAAMVNLLGDLWQQGEPNWAAACAYPAVKLHLYGKREARPGRKMGHLTATAASVEQALALALAARQALTAASCRASPQGPAAAPP